MAEAGALHMLLDELQVEVSHARQAEGCDTAWAVCYMMIPQANGQPPVGNVAKMAPRISHAAEGLHVGQHALQGMQLVAPGAQHACEANAQDVADVLHSAVDSWVGVHRAKQADWCDARCVIVECNLDAGGVFRSVAASGCHVEAGHAHPEADAAAQAG